MDKRSFLLGGLFGVAITAFAARRLFSELEVVLDDVLDELDAADQSEVSIDGDASLLLTAIGPHKAAVTRATRALLGSDAPNATALARQLPFRLLSDASMDEVNAAAAQFERAGATVVID